MAKSWHIGILKSRNLVNSGPNKFRFEYIIPAEGLN